MCNYFTSNTKSINTYMRPLHNETITLCGTRYILHGLRLRHSLHKKIPQLSLTLNWGILQGLV